MLSNILRKMCLIACIGSLHAQSDEIIPISTEQAKKSGTDKTDGVYQRALYMLPKDLQNLVLGYVNWKEQAHTLDRHKYEVSSISFSPNNKYIATGAMDQKIWLWDTATGKRLRIFEYALPIKAVCFEPNGRTIACTVYKDNTISIRRVDTGERIAYIPHHNAERISYSPNGTYFAWSNTYDNGQVHVYHIDDKYTAMAISQFDVGSCFVFSPCSNYIVIGGNEGISSYHPVTKRLKWHMPADISHGYAEPIRCVDYSSDRRLVGSGSDKTVKIWDVITTRDVPCCIATLAHTTVVDAIAFSPDNKHIACGTAEGVVYMWDIATGECINKLQAGTKSVLQVAYSPDGQYIATRIEKDKTVKMWAVIKK